MNMNRFAKNVIVAAGLIMSLTVPGSARGDNPQNRPAPTPNPASSAPQKITSVADYFAGLDFTDEQKASIEKVKQDSEAKKALVAKDTKLDDYQKGAMITGYTRLEYGEIFKLLTPAQQKVVRQRMAANKAANQKARRPAPPAPPTR